MITLFQIDKSGNDLFEKDYSVVLVVNQKKVYGINVTQKIKDEMIFKLRSGELKIQAPTEKTKKNRLRIRFHTAIIISLIEHAISDFSLDEVNIQICNDIDGHFHEIKDMIFKHFTKTLPNLKSENIVLAKFQKPSLIDNAGRVFRTKDRDKLKEFTQINLNSEEILRIIKK